MASSESPTDQHIANMTPQQFKEYEKKRDEKAMNSAKELFEREAEARKEFFDSFNELTFVNAISTVTKETAGEEKKLSKERHHELVDKLHEAGQRTEMCLEGWVALATDLQEDEDASPDPEDDFISRLTALRKQVVEANKGTRMREDTVMEAATITDDERLRELKKLTGFSKLQGLFEGYNTKVHKLKKGEAYLESMEQHTGSASVNQGRKKAGKDVKEGEEFMQEVDKLRDGILSLYPAFQEKSGSGTVRAGKRSARAGSTPPREEGEGAHQGKGKEKKART